MEDGFVFSPEAQQNLIKRINKADTALLAIFRETLQWMKHMNWSRNHTITILKEIWEALE